ncbi:MAG TPA: NAD(P)-binding domain-containing protein, partial [Actinospica sp.]|nr:NAD(P)-binding domain-containing protein [Actinospica sp.]
MSGAPQIDTSEVRDRPGRFAVGVIGTGRVGSVLGAALARAGHRVVAASAVSDRSRRRAAELLPDVPLLPPPEVAEQAELLLLGVPDDVLPELVVGLADAGLFRPGQTVLHPS